MITVLTLDTPYLAHHPTAPSQAARSVPVAAEDRIWMQKHKDGRLLSLRSWPRRLMPVGCTHKRVGDRSTWASGMMRVRTMDRCRTNLCLSTADIGTQGGVGASEEGARGLCEAGPELGLGMGGSRITACGAEIIVSSPFTACYQVSHNEAAGYAQAHGAPQIKGWQQLG